MPLDPEAFADMVIQTVEAALGPERERLAVIEALVKQDADLRDRLVVVETKTALPLPLPPAPPEPIPVDLTPVIERLAAVEARQAVLGDVRDRLVVVETKTAMPVVPLPPEAGFDDLRERLVNLETKAAGPSLADMGVTELRTTLASVQAKVFEVSERVAVVETRPLLPGPPGEKGADGLGFDDLSVLHDGERALTLRFVRGDTVKEFTVTLATPIWKGPFVEGRKYQPFDVVRYARSAWICKKETTISPSHITRVDGSAAGPQGEDFWSPFVEKGRDGKDGRDAPTLPIVTVGGMR